jgi:hypothetical protein
MVEGVDDFERRLVTAVTGLKRRAAAALFERGEANMAIAKERTPVDEGVMRGTGHVADPVIEESEVSVTLAYGGPAEAYVVRQHEDLSLEHSVGEAKFLEKSVLEAAPTLVEDVANRMR